MDINGKSKCECGETFAAHANGGACGNYREDPFDIPVDTSYRADSYGKE
jgi:hypothetical protein